jgi:hypothetical protein
MSDSFLCADMTRRNKIRTNAGSGHLTIPLGKKFYKLRICDVELPAEKSWRASHWQQIYQNYVNTQYFGRYSGFFNDLYQKDFQYLVQINTEIILFLLKCFNIDVEIIKTTDLNLDPNLQGTDSIIAAMKNVGGQIYLSGPSGRNYLEFPKFQNNDLELKFFEFEHPVYKQRYEDFIPNLSAIDLLFNVGETSEEIIRKSGSVKDSERIE